MIKTVGKSDGFYVVYDHVAHRRNIGKTMNV